MNSATMAQTDESFRGYAVKISGFSTCKLYDFADGSFLVVHDNGRTEVDTITC